MRDNPCLMLNVDYQPNSIISWKRAVTLLFQNLHSPEMGAIAIENYQGRFIRSAGGENFELPAVIQSVKYIKAKKRVPFSRKNVFLRDEMKCQYCLKRFRRGELTFDHIISRDRWKKLNLPGTPTYWENIVSACYKCNTIKANLLLEDCGLTLHKKPTKLAPNRYVPGLSPFGKVPKEWHQYVKHLYPEVNENGLFNYN